jgi:predicted RNA-binding Zn-ribbon protein involved in translation (DUF1610 family)
LIGVNRATQQKLLALRTLAEHPGTPDAERENALARIREIEAKIQVEAGVEFVKISRKGIASFKRRVREASPIQDRTVHDDWPFGWEGPRDDLKEFETGEDMEGGYVIGWKCPDCGSHVTRGIDCRMMLRFASRPGALEDHIRMIASGCTNYLCPECWRKWNER